MVGLVGAAAARAGGWSRPFQIVAPFSLDLLPPQLAFSPSGVTSVAFAVQDADAPADSTAYLAVRGAVGEKASLWRMASAKQVLAEAYQNDTAGLLLGMAPSGETCCSSVAFAARSPRGALSAPQRLVGSLAGATSARLLTASGRLLAVIASEHGVWYAQSAPGGTRFGATHRLTSGSGIPEAVSAVGLPAGGGAVLWAARSGIDGVTGQGPAWIVMASGTARKLPGSPRPVIRLPKGHSVDELAAARSATGVTVAWIESWVDDGGGYHSAARVADISRHPVPRTLSAVGELATDLSLAADASGDQVVSWKGCPDAAGTCSARTARRPARGRFAAQRLGPMDPSEEPAAAIGPTGASVVGWVNSGHVYAATAGLHGRSFGAGSRVSATNYATDLTVGVAPTGLAFAAWTQGTLEQSVIGATLGLR